MKRQNEAKKKEIVVASQLAMNVQSTPKEENKRDFKIKQNAFDIR